MSEITISIEEIPHGHGLSFKRGIVAGLLEEDFDEKLPYGHDASFKKGKELGNSIKDEVAKQVKP